MVLLLLCVSECVIIDGQWFFFCCVSLLLSCLVWSVVPAAAEDDRNDIQNRRWLIKIVPSSAEFLFVLEIFFC